MSYILLGHGDLLVHRGAPPCSGESIVVPRGTTIQLYTDGGQGLVIGPDELDVWSQVFCAAAVDAGTGLHNLVLHGGDDLANDQLASDLERGGHTLIRPGVDGMPDPIRLCTGTPRTCPPPVDPFGEEVTHDCGGLLGLLGRLPGPQGVVHWLECASITDTRRPVTTPERAEQRTHVAWDPNWVPDEAAQRAIARVNRRIVRAASDRTIVNFVIGGSAFLIGDSRLPDPFSCHHPMHAYYVRELQADNLVHGKIRVRRPWWENGWFDVAGVPQHRETLVRECIARFAPHKGIGFVELRTRQAPSPSGGAGGKGARSHR
ncbi:hypothetical protein [Streptomyces sp. WAC06614]|uniref:hypothetical protein n=1 Tax=Streptomyces sp. WAC06614 TaxID=2487416 RepID=UPI000F79CF8A|nr:hypothetical protein [Streptomyces sp. WAC06614]RSS79754.1 hypothetical protein EF918_16165 [Streptomyces sp. WAC06614]